MPANKSALAIMRAAKVTFGTPRVADKASINGVGDNGTAVNARASCSCFDQLAISLGG